MKFKIIFLLILMVCNLNFTYSQTSPYALSPKWMFGYYGGLDFTSGSPVLNNLNPLVSEEMTSTICDPTKNIVAYSNNYRVVGLDNIPVATILSSSTSSTNGPILIPDPASPTTQWYLFTGNAEVTNGMGGGTAQGGISAYRIVKSGSSVTVTFLSTLAWGTDVSEQLYTSSDGAGGYWLITRQKVNNGSSSKYNSWHITSTGIGSVVTSNGSIASSWYTAWQGSIKVSRCQDRIAYVGNSVEVYTWNKTTGQVGTLLASTNTGTIGYGCEFSADGNFLYYTSFTDNKLYQLEIATGTVYTEASWTAPISGSLQLGLDGKIYMATGYHFTHPAYLGVINNPTVAGTGANFNATGFALGVSGATSPSVYRGVSNIAWINPNLPNITSSVGATCLDYNFGYEFKTYFQDNITVVPNSEVWNFGDGTGAQTGLGATPSHTFPVAGTYTVTLTVTDATCNETWTNTTSLTTSCSMPVELVNFTGTRYNDIVKLIWLTTNEVNNDKFVIERSTDGYMFNAIGMVKGSGNSEVAKYWSFYDNNPTQGINYYRLAQYDIDGKVTYSNIVSINFGNDYKFLVYPNPFFNEITVEIFDEFGAKTTIIVYDALGREVKTITDKSLKISFGSDLKSGLYVLKIIRGDDFYVTDIIKK